jgi:hypothetical protein
MDNVPKMLYPDGRLPSNMGDPRMQTSDDRQLTGQAQVSIEFIVAKTGELPPIPSIALKALKMSEDPEVDIQDLQAALSQDQALTAQILRMANSGLYGLEHKIATISHAVAILGLNTTRYLLSAACVQQFSMPGKINPGPLATSCSRIIPGKRLCAPRQLPGRSVMQRRRRPCLPA